jgi:hypothetical protein
MEERYVWSRRLTTAEVAMARTRDERVSIVAVYLEEMKRLDLMLRRMFTEGPRNHGMTEFYVAEAELWLERVKRE